MTWGAALLYAAAWMGLAAAVFPLGGGYSSGDLSHYRDVARQLLHGAVPYRDFAFEYPPLALLPITIPGALAGSGIELASRYHLALLTFNAACVAVLGVCATRIAAATAPHVPARVAGARFAAIALAGVAVYPWRFDLFVALLAGVAVMLALEEKPAWSGIVLGAAIATKLYPAVLAPVIGAWHVAGGRRRSATRFAAATLASTAIAVLPLLAAAPHDFASFITYHLARGLQIESTAAGVVLLAHAAAGTAVEMVENYGAVHLAPPIGADAQPALAVLAVGGVALTTWMAFARFRAERLRAGAPAGRSLVAAALAAVVVVIVTNKVASPQYMAWLLPLAPLASSVAFRLSLAASALTVAVFPGLYVALLHVEPLPVLLLNARNLCLVALAGCLLWSLRPAAAAPSPPEAEG
ncbi:MAG: glycosyltransferase family 87 protein [Gemmatimonadota bacterium]|nr:glycosyltransferase family 87 protein [Gemmatimonadota bacterium]